MNRPRSLSLVVIAVFLAAVVTASAYPEALRNWLQEDGPAEWATFFAFLFAGAINIYVAYNYEESVWVNFKLFGLFGITFIFLLLQTLWLSRYMTESEQEDGE